MLLAPDTDIAAYRGPAGSARAEGEDPFLNGDQNSVYAATVKSRHVIATLKHYTANNQETNRLNGQNAIMTERTLREVYALAFEMVVHAPASARSCAPSTRSTASTRARTR